MATPVIIPQLGNTVESCIIVEWKRSPGQPIEAGDPICDIETDKAVMEVESPASGTVLAHFFSEGEDVPVLTTIAAIGEPGEDFAHLRPDADGGPVATGEEGVAGGEGLGARGEATRPMEEIRDEGAFAGVSPRARKLADRSQLDLTGLVGTGPGGRIIERDVRAALETTPRMSPVAQAMAAAGEYVAPTVGTGPRGRVMSRDLVPKTSPAVEPPAGPVPPPTISEEDVERTPLKGARKVIAQRMLSSLQTTAQLTLQRTADARALLAYRQQLKGSSEPLGLQRVSINDLILYAVSRILPQFPDLNAHFSDDSILRFKNVHLGVAVDTPRGLLVPVVRNAHRLSLRQLSEEARRLAEACQNRRITPDELTGGTFTVTNLGALGIESFTPVLNPPEVAILGVGNVNLKPVETEGQVQFHPHIGLSLTINHQVVDGAPAARFLQALADGLAQFDLLLAL